MRIYTTMITAIFLAMFTLEIKAQESQSHLEESDEGLEEIFRVTSWGDYFSGPGDMCAEAQVNGNKEADAKCAPLSSKLLKVERHQVVGWVTCIFVGQYLCQAEQVEIDQDINEY